MTQSTQGRTLSLAEEKSVDRQIQETEDTLDGVEVSRASIVTGKQIAS